MIHIPLEFFSYTNEPAAAARDGVLLYANAAAMELLGRDCVGRTATVLFGEIVTQSESEQFLCQLRLHDSDYSLRVVRQDGIQLFFLTRCEEEPSMLSDSFFAALRSNMMNLGMALELVRDQTEGEAGENIQEYLQDLSCCQYRINRLISNAVLLRDHAQNRLVAREVPLSMSWLVHSAMDCVQFLQPDLRLELQIQEGLAICGDPALLKRLLFNLLSNCVRHAHGMTRVKVSLQEAGERLYLTVDDDGCGMAAETMSRVFERYRYDYALSEMGKGTGMGLSVARAIAQVHGGAMLLESKEGEGTSVRVGLKRAKPLHSCECGEEATRIKEALLDLADALHSRHYHESLMD